MLLAIFTGVRTRTIDGIDLYNRPSKVKGDFHNL